jgi:hypothetical protein
LATTTYAIIASAQLLVLFALWTPSGIVWWRAEGAAFWALTAAYAASWLLLMKATFDAGAEAHREWLEWSTPARSDAAIDLAACVTAMREALRRGDWVAFGTAFDSLGRVLERPPQ